MTSKLDLPNDPPKLVDTEYAYAEILAQGNLGYETAPDEVERFCRARPEPLRSRSGLTWLVPAALAAAALAALAPSFAARAPQSISAEPTHLAPGAVRERSEASAGELVPSVSRPARVDASSSRPPPSPSGRELPSRPSRARALPPPKVESPSDNVVREAAPDCRALARAGEASQAEACYAERSAGTGLDAETALLEIARRRRDVLADPAGALGTLEEYRTRFPNGSLRGEADLAYIVLLARVGRSSEALEESERVLASPSGRERAFELRLLRGNLYRKNLSNPALAAREYAAAAELEGATSEAVYLLGLCREELGDAAGAAAAYRRYLERSAQGKRAGEVRERLAKVSSP